MSLQLTVNLRELYERLCPECKAAFLEVVRLGIPPEAILAALGIKQPEKEGEAKRAVTSKK